MGEFGMKKKSKRISVGIKVERAWQMTDRIGSFC